MFNLDQTPFSYVPPGKYTFDLKGSKTVPIKSVDNKRQITETFALTAADSFLSIQLIYIGKLSEVYSSMVSLVALMLPPLQIIGRVMKNMSDCLKKNNFPYFKAKKE